MRRKLIKQDAFEKITNESVTTAERELVAAESVLARALGRDHLALRSFTTNTALFETLEDTFVHTGYEIKNGSVTFNNIEELVIDESSRKEKMRATLSEMIDNVLMDNNPKANELFKKYMSNVRWNEAKGDNPFKKKEKGENPFGDKKENPFGGKKEKGENPFKKKKGKKDDGKKEELFKKAKKAGKDLAEAFVTSVNVLDYVDYMKVGPTLAEATTKQDDKGNITDIRIPNLNARNESRLNRIDWKSLNSKVAEHRRSIAGLTENQDFCKAIANLKRQNGFSDLKNLEEARDQIVKAWPEILYATQGELAQVIGESLQALNVSNFGDDTCEFMAESILRKAHEVYTEKVKQVLHLASAPKMEANADAYKYFQFVAESFFPSLDQRFGLERKVFSDLYESLGTVYKKADRQGDNALKNETASYLNELAAVLNNEAKPEIAFVEEAAEFLATVLETNLESGKWVVSNTPHMTVNGDHPDMAKKASHGYSPSKDFSGNWGDEAPAIGQDDHNYKSGKHAKKMRNDSWGQAGPEGDIFPKLKNPYVPKPFGDYTMKGEKGVDKDNTNFSLWKTDDTWPNLSNPYVPKEAGGEGGKGHKMKNGSETDLVVDK